MGIRQQVSPACLNPPGVLKWTHTLCYDKMAATCQGGVAPGESVAILCQRKEGELLPSVRKVGGVRGLNFA